MAELQSCDRDRVVHKSKIFPILPFTESLLTPSLDPVTHDRMCLCPAASCNPVGSDLVDTKKYIPGEGINAVYFVPAPIL